MEKKSSSDILHMRGGTGPGSFNAFSKSLQSNLNEFFWPRLSHAIANACSKQQVLLKIVAHDDDDDAENRGDARFSIADFGCSCAISTINSMHFMAKCVFDQAAAFISPSAKKQQQQQQLHIQAFFNDLPCNDYNTLFTLLHFSQPSIQEAGLHFMPCGLPGSFYSRLFPSRYLNVGLCTIALHNLSKVPDVVHDRTSPAWNENGVWILEGCKPETAMEYKKQFEDDFTCFLRQRSEELVPGGLLFCVMLASKINETSFLPSMDHNHLYTNLQVAWRQLVSEGFLEKGSLDSFNLPLFMPTIDEVKDVLCSDILRMEFEVVELEYVEVERAPKHVWMESAAADAQTWGKACETMVRNFVGSLIQAHLEPPKFELLMERLRLVATADDEIYRSSLLRLVVLTVSRREVIVMKGMGAR